MLTDFTELTLSVIADAMPPLPKGEALAVLIRMLKSVLLFSLPGQLLDPRDLVIGGGAGAHG